MGMIPGTFIVKNDPGTVTQDEVLKNSPQAFGGAKAGGCGCGMMK
jgi:hypothetical protein